MDQLRHLFSESWMLIPHNSIINKLICSHISHDNIIFMLKHNLIPRVILYCILIE